MNNVDGSSAREKGRMTPPRAGGTALWVLLLHRCAFLVPLAVAFAALAAATISVANATPATPATPAVSAEPPAPPAAAELPPRCAANYAALLDLAELAREYGKSSVSFVNAIDSVAGQLDDCLYDAQGPEQGPAWKDLVNGPADPSMDKRRNRIGI
jgi:hypothetical protein